ncbi:uracil-DNA glycosylase [Bacillus sp. mrc49]|nr:uracil-DNA glycosylase [Bacillus sp. mrc49]PJN91061.1 uracil-DNA glycosylase [Bacillus sp. mrc49]PJN91210.1 uracil-DNA glycosylase [Bacillus sp. mrc49]PJN91349.1 uracil-DNA glycosylase [Bacillus sp. mrc49]
MKRVNCMLCRHFYVTWDPNFPKGCRAFQFKTANLPSLDVFRSSGQVCLEFTAKKNMK